MLSVVILIALVLAIVVGWKRGRLDVSVLDKWLFVQLGVLGIILGSLVYGAYALAGKGPLGWITVLMMWFGMVFSLAALVAGLPSKKGDSRLGAVVAYAVVLLGVAFAFWFLSVWNASRDVPALLIGFGFGACVVCLFAQARDVFKENARLLAVVVMLSLASMVLVSDSLVVLVLELFGLVASVIGLMLKGKRSFALVSILGVVSVVVISRSSSAGLVPGIVGVFAGVFLWVAMHYYTHGKFRPAKTVAKSERIHVWLAMSFEGTFAMLLISSLGLLIGFGLGEAQGKGLEGVVFAVQGMAFPLAFLFSKEGERKEQFAGYLFGVLAGVLVLVFEGYQVVMAKSLGAAARVINVGKVEVLSALLLGAAVVLLASSFARREEDDARITWLIACVLGIVIAVLFKAEAAAAFLVGVSAAGTCVGLLTVLGSACGKGIMGKDELCAKVHDEGLVVGLLVLGALIWAIAPLLV